MDELIGITVKTASRTAAPPFSRLDGGQAKRPRILMGRTDLVTPEAALGRSSFPVTLPYDDALHDLFLAMRADVPEVFLGVDAVLEAATEIDAGSAESSP